MRGKVLASHKMHQLYRITPAYAGKSRHEWGVYRANQDHPRLCGEKGFSRITMRSIRGSPPPMRGKETYIQVNAGFDRITPAYAGKSFRLRKKQPVLWDHPRLCGEKPHNTIVIWVLVRITPAYAGKRHVAIPRLTGIQDHPRLCGEKIKDDALLTEQEGSPPPMRGKGTVLSLQHVRSGITPAYAGKSLF